MQVKIQELSRGYLVTHQHENFAANLYAEADIRAAFHRAASLMGIEPATLYVPPAITEEELPPHATADSDDNAGGLKAGEAV